MDLDPKELHRLFVAKADGVISPEDFAKLCTCLSASVGARRQWFLFVDAEVALGTWAQRNNPADFGLSARVSGASKVEITACGASPFVRRQVGSLAAGLAIGIALFALVQSGLVLAPRRDDVSLSRGSIPQGRAKEPTTLSVAFFKRGVDTQWGSTGGPLPEVGGPLDPGVLVLRSGVAEVEFIQGARLCMEGPAEVRLISGSEAFCHSGRVTVHVPEQARGFKLGTPTGDVVDLGTDFGVDLSGANPELVVFKGEVEWHRKGSPVRKYTTGEAIDLSAPGEPVFVAANVASFAFSNELAAKVSDAERAAFNRWEDLNALLQQRDDVRLHYDFTEGQDPGVIHNTAAATAGSQDGAVVGCQRVDGRLRGKRALQFRSVSDRVRLQMSGEFADFTVCAWVQVQSLPARQSALFMSEGIRPGSLHWQVLQDGALCLGILSAEDRPIVEDYVSPVVFSPERVGLWTHIAVVMDSLASEVRFVVNGLEVSRDPLKAARVVTPRTVELGNWTPSPAYWGTKPVRNFAGVMDEVSFFARALRTAEIRDMLR